MKATTPTPSKRNPQNFRCLACGHTTMSVKKTMAFCPACGASQYGLLRKEAEIRRRRQMEIEGCNRIRLEVHSERARMAEQIQAAFAKGFERGWHRARDEYAPTTAAASGAGAVVKQSHSTFLNSDYTTYIKDSQEER